VILPYHKDNSFVLCFLPVWNLQNIIKIAVKIYVVIDVSLTELAVFRWLCHLCVGAYPKIAYMSKYKHSG